MTEGNGQPTPLNEHLFSLDDRHEAYASTANDLLMAGAHAPSLALGIARNHLADVAEKSGLGRQFARWEEDFEEAFRTAFALAEAEDWPDLDADEVRDLVKECYEATNEARKSVGSESVEESDFDTWISILLVGLVHEAEEWASRAVHLH